MKYIQLHAHLSSFPGEVYLCLGWKVVKDWAPFGKSGLCGWWAGRCCIDPCDAPFCSDQISDWADPQNALLESTLMRKDGEKKTKIEFEELQLKFMRRSLKYHVSNQIELLTVQLCISGGSQRSLRSFILSVPGSHTIHVTAHITRAVLSLEATRTSSPKPAAASALFFLHFGLGVSFWDDLAIAGRNTVETSDSGVISDWQSFSWHPGKHHTK